MQLELDHLFICTEPEAPEAESLKTLGFTEGIRRPHPGQGTTNVCFFFENAYLELLWACDRDEIQSRVVRPTGLWERCCWKETGACPFGIGLRLTTPNSQKLPFSIWDYEAPFLPPGISIPMATNSLNISEPLIFLSPSTQKPVRYPPEKRPPLIHQLALKEITAARITLPETGDFSPEVTALIELELVQFVRGDCDHLEIEFDNNRGGRQHDFTPILPLSIQW
jgi:Glyoxalase-like domain